MSDYTTSPELAFQDATRRFEELRASLQTDCLSRTEADVERFIDENQDEISRLLLQGHLDVRGGKEVPEVVVGADGVVRNQSRSGSRELESIFGRVWVKRLTMFAPGVPGIRPLDYDLNLPPRFYSHAVQHRLCSLVSGSSFDAALEELERATAAHVPKRQAEQVVREAAVDFEQFYPEVMALPSDATTPLYMSTDCAGVVMIESGLTEYTQKAAAKAKKKMKKRLSTGEKRNRKRMASIVAVFDQELKPRTPEAILDPNADSKMPRPQNKKVFTYLENSHKVAIGKMFDEAERRDPDHQRQWVALVDGDPHQTKYIRAEARRRGIKNLLIVLDIVHVIEYLWRAAWRLFDREAPAAEHWVEERLLQILRGKASAVAGGIRRIATNRGFKGQNRTVMDSAADYILNHKSMMKYDEYLEQGLAIATGVIEGACRFLVRDRMDITGARWGLETAEAVLRLRALKKNGDFDAYWKFHEERERERNYPLIAANDNGMRQFRAAG